MKYFGYKENGCFDGFFDDEVHETIPKTAIKITDELWQNLLGGVYDVNLATITGKDTLTIVDKETCFIEKDNRLESMDIPPSTQDMMLASLLKQNAELQQAQVTQSKLNAELLKQIAELQGGGK